MQHRPQTRLLERGPLDSEQSLSVLKNLNLLVGADQPVTKITSQPTNQLFPQACAVSTAPEPLCQSHCES